MTFAENTVQRLLDSRTAEGVWVGHLSSSALSTATAMIALTAQGEDPDLVAKGRDWLEKNQNSDGGWGDTVRSKSNISTTALCWAALPDCAAASRAEQWLCRAAGSVTPPALSKAIAERYGKDQTFSVPILTALAIGGRLGDRAQAWKFVPQLPFELAALPSQWFQWLQLPVVSYALPALIAIGLARHRNKPSRNLPARAMRKSVTQRVLRILRHIQPSCGGFLEATPLTSFVAMSLIAGGLGKHEVVKSCLEFLRTSIREDGSWPIDTNLSTWVTTLAVNALCQGPSASDALGEQDRWKLTEWLLAQQFQTEHPYTHAAPGAWAWTNLPGAVPDADDTAGALLALKKLGINDPKVQHAAQQGIRWLLDLQNRDGGMPTFCRGWGHLPFDRSGPDLTAHALRAWHAWLPSLSASDSTRVRLAMSKAHAYLRSTQQQDGSWIPLWFGSQHAPLEQNRTFGTSRVVIALSETGAEANALKAGIAWLAKAQNPDGGWGGAPGVESSIEETSLAVAALAVSAREAHLQQIEAGLRWLSDHTQNGTVFPSSPIGFYFASLWYFEDLYPLLFATAAVRA
jgi:squalene-hopene/tetraprenyl-beta-curcumene cyclase